MNEDQAILEAKVAALYRDCHRKWELASAKWSVVDRDEYVRSTVQGASFTYFTAFYLLSGL